MNNISFRCADIKDVNDIYLIDQEYEYEQYSIDMVKASIEDEKYFNVILSIDDTAVGYLSALMVADECELIKIVVKSSCRGNGYGKLLIDTLLSKCRENFTKKIFLEVRNDNTEAKNLYEKCGFKKVHTRKGYYAGVDADIYWCELDGKKD